MVGAPNGRPKTDTSREAAELYGDAYLESWEKLNHCLTCDRPMRPASTRVQDWPATVSRATATMCQTCRTRKAYQTNVSSNMSIAEALRDPVITKRSGTGKMPSRMPAQRTRAEIAKGWGELEHAVAWQVVTHVPNVPEARELMDMLGLFDESQMAWEVAPSDFLANPKSRYS